MSFFMIDDKIEKMVNGDRQEEKELQAKPKARHTQPHTDKAKKKISETQSKRYELIRQLVSKGSQKAITEERIREICKDTIHDYFEANAIPAFNKKNNNKRQTEKRHESREEAKEENQGA